MASEPRLEPGDPWEPPEGWMHRCPNCGGEPCTAQDAWHYVHCPECGMQGPWESSAANAVDVWNCLAEQADPMEREVPRW